MLHSWLFAWLQEVINQSSCTCLTLSKCLQLSHAKWSHQSSSSHYIRGFWTQKFYVPFGHTQHEFMCPFQNFMCLLFYELFPYYQSWIFSYVILNTCTSFKNDILERNGISCLWLNKITLRPGVVVDYNRKLFHFGILLFSRNKFWNWNLNNYKSNQDIRMKLTPFSIILKELSNDTKYIGVWPPRRWFFLHKTKIYRTICPKSGLDYRTFVVLVGVFPIADAKK